MCGIAGYYSTAKHDDSLKAAMNEMRYRGPDSSGDYVFEKDGRFSGVGHVRLKVVDLDNRSAQPFITASGDSLVVFNGEVYNYEALKVLLPKHPWRTTSDTEVIAELLEAFGDSVVSKFNGIFAIARVNLTDGSISLFRDPLGVKPLYYSVVGEKLFFASEIKALRHFPIDIKVSEEDLLECLNFGYVHEPNTGFTTVKKVAPGEIIYQKGGQLFRDKFFYDASKSNFSENTLTEAIQRQCKADVPLGTFFSGGADSTVIASQVEGDLLYINCRLDDSENDEEKNAKQLAGVFQRKLLTVDLPSENNIDQIVQVVDRIVKGVEEPITDLTYSVSADLAKLAREKGFTVMLSGMGADEIFGGYLRYYIVKYHWFFDPMFRAYLMLSMIRKKGDKHKLDRIKNYLNEKIFLKKYARLVGYFSGDDLKKCIGIKKYDQFDDAVFNRLGNFIPDSCIGSNLSKMRYLEFKGFLAHNLTVADKSSMESSIELRVPFLDLELVSGWIGEKVDKKGRNALGKKPLLSLIRKNIKFKWSPFSKTGFNPPISRFFEKAGREGIVNIVCCEEMLEVFDKQGLESIIDGCFDSKKINFHKIWQLVFIARWLQYWQPTKEIG